MSDDSKHEEHQNPRKEFWALLEEFTYAMLTTHDTIDGRKLMRSRPMAQYLDAEGGVIRFMSRRTDDKVEEIEDEHDVAIVYAQPENNRFVSVSGRATNTTDRALIKRLWGPAADAWFEGNADTADVVVIEVRPIEAEYWRKDDTALERGFEMVKGLVTDEEPDIGANAKVDFSNPGEAA